MRMKIIKWRGPASLPYRQSANMDYGKSKLIQAYSEINTILDRKS